MVDVKIDKKDKNIIVVTLVIGSIMRIFIDNGMDIALLCFCMYVSHKYIGSTDNIKEYESYVFSNKDKYDRGRKLFVGLVDVYIISRIIFMILNQESSYVLTEMLLIVIFYDFYEKYLDKKYVISSNISKEKNNVVLIKRKILLSIGIVMFVMFSIITFNTFKKLDTDGYVKYGRHEYKISSIEDKRKIEIQLGGTYMMADEDDKNSKYFDTYLDDGRYLMKKQILKSYLFIGTVFMFILCFIEGYSKDEKAKSIASNILAVGALIFIILNLNFDIGQEKMNLSSYFHEYMN